MEFWFDPSSKEIDIIVSHLEQSINLEERVLYVYGEGKQPKKTYDDFEKHGIKVMWKGIKGPLWAKFLSVIASSYYGLIKVEKESGLDHYY